MSISPMSEKQFWAIIETTLIAQSDQDAQVAALEKELMSLKPEEIEAFDLTFSQVRNKSYTWDLWAVAYIAGGGCSDDGFHYFQSWMISKGETIFNQLLDTPDTLAQIIPQGYRDMLEFEAWDYCPVTIWEQKTGQDPYDDNSTYLKNLTTPLEYVSDPTGTPFDEDEAYLAKTFPQTWERFGETPL